jgi:hypothetical protein
LFARVYEQFKGKSLPPDVGLRNLFHGTYKVPLHRTALALRMFRNCAAQAGFFSINADRLISPAGVTSTERKSVTASKEEALSETEKQARTSSGGGGDGPRGVHEAISGLLRYLPPPGTPWNAQKKESFLKAFTAAIELIYPEEGQ